MTKEQIIDEVYNKYTTKYMGYDDAPSKELFLFEIKNNPEFSEKWGLNIGERELSLEERQNLYFKLNSEFRLVHKNMDEQMDKHNTPTKLITLTYNNEKIENYE